MVVVTLVLKKQQSAFSIQSLNNIKHLVVVVSDMNGYDPSAPFDELRIKRGLSLSGMGMGMRQRARYNRAHNNDDEDDWDQVEMNDNEMMDPPPEDTMESLKNDLQRLRKRHDKHMNKLRVELQNSNNEYLNKLRVSNDEHVNKLRVELQTAKVEAFKQKGIERATLSRNKRLESARESDKAEKSRQRVMAKVGEACFRRPELIRPVLPDLDEDICQMLNYYLPRKPQRKRRFSQAVRALKGDISSVSEPTESSSTTTTSESSGNSEYTRGNLLAFISTGNRKENYDSDSSDDGA
jgi:hypothetical protein